MSTSPNSELPQKSSKDESIIVDPITGFPADIHDILPTVEDHKYWHDLMDEDGIYSSNGLPVDIDTIMPFNYDDDLAEVSSITSTPDSPLHIQADGGFKALNLAEVMDGPTQLDLILSDKADTKDKIEGLKENLFNSYIKEYDEVMQYFVGNSATKGYEFFFQDPQMLMDLVREASPVAIGFLFRVEGVYDCIYKELNDDANKIIIQDLTATAVLFREYELVNQLLSIKHARDYLISHAGRSLRASCRTRGNDALCNMIDSRISPTSELGFFSTQTSGNKQVLSEPRNASQYGPA